MHESGIFTKWHSRCLVLVVLLSGCAAPQVSFNVPAGSGEKTVVITARSFAFEPNEIFARQGDRLLLRVHNNAGIGHNLTLRNPQGKVLFSLDMAEDQTLARSLELTEAGDYPFYCDKPLHATMGMKGRIVVSPAP